ncbi:N-acetyltransferase family protein [Pradoshia sp.]
MKPNITIRDAAIEDLPRIVDIYNSTIEGRMVTADLHPVTVESRVDWFRDHHPSTRPLWVMTEEEKIIGWLSFQDFYGRPAYKATAEISIYMDASCRKRGIGGAFLEEAIRQAPELGIHTLLGFIFGHNEPSIRLFKRYGFESWAHLPNVAKLDGVERDLEILGKRVAGKLDS